MALDSLPLSVGSTPSSPLPALTLCLIHGLLQIRMSLFFWVLKRPDQSVFCGVFNSDWLWVKSQTSCEALWLRTKRSSVIGWNVQTCHHSQRPDVLFFILSPDAEELLISASLPSRHGWIRGWSFCFTIHRVVKVVSWYFEVWAIADLSLLSPAAEPLLTSPGTAVVKNPIAKVYLVFAILRVKQI